MQARADHSSDPMHCDHLDGGLVNAEFFWRDHYKFLEDNGYRLRPRYSPDWEPSWIKFKKDPSECEDGYCQLVSSLLQLSLCGCHHTKATPDRD